LCWLLLHIVSFSWKLYDIFLIFINVLQQLSFNFDIMFRDFVFVKVWKFLFIDQFWKNYIKNYMSWGSTFLGTFFSWWSSNDFWWSCQYALEAFLSFRPTCFRVRYVPKTKSIPHDWTSRLWGYKDWGDYANAHGIVFQAGQERV
jgi:hypothetical protein